MFTYCIRVTYNCGVWSPSLWSPLLTLAPLLPLARLASRLVQSLPLRTRLDNLPEFPFLSLVEVSGQFLDVEVSFRDHVPSSGH